MYVPASAEEVPQINLLFQLSQAFSCSTIVSAGEMPLQKTLQETKTTCREPDLG
jgi:hypothetical protein